MTLKEYVEGEIQKRWVRENEEYLTKHGFPAGCMSSPEKIPATQPGDFPGSALTYDREFLQKATEAICRKATSDLEAQKLIEGAFQLIKRGSTGVADGDHHSPTYGEEVFRQFYIDTKAALEKLQK
jgi:hypothetical protein